MSLDPSVLGAIAPNRYLTFTLPVGQQDHVLRIAVLDSPYEDTDVRAATSAAAMWVPPGRESDWIFSTYAGHLQLLLSTSQTFSRLILIGNVPSPGVPTSFSPIFHSSSSTTFQQNLTPLLAALIPKSVFPGIGKIPEVPLLVYEDEVASSSILEICEGPQVGEMMIENVELVIDGLKEFRRRLRFKRMPNLVQTQMRIHPKNDPCLVTLDNVEFELDIGELVQPYLSPMIAGISVVSPSLEGRILDGIRPKVLCLGVGGGALLCCMSAKLNFEVVGVEEDEVVLKVAKRYFGLDNNELITLFAEDGIRYVKKLRKSITKGSKFDIVMVDMDSSDMTLGVCAPPAEFIRRSVLLAVRDLLIKKGALIINTVTVRKSSYERFIILLQEVFEELYEIDVGNGENFVLIATKSKSRVKNASDSKKGTILNELKMMVPTLYVDSIRKISERGLPSYK